MEGTELLGLANLDALRHRRGGKKFRDQARVSGFRSDNMAADCMTMGFQLIKIGISKESNSLLDPP
jgi:hypothetical protein